MNLLPHPTMLILGADAMTQPVIPMWVWQIAIGIIAFLVLALQGVILWWARGVNDRLDRGERKFDRLFNDDGEIKVSHALSMGDIRVQMQKEFVRREEHDRQTDVFMRQTTDLTREVAKANALLIHVIGRKEAQS